MKKYSAARKDEALQLTDKEAACNELNTKLRFCHITHLARSFSDRQPNRTCRKKKGKNTTSCDTVKVSLTLALGFLM